MNTANKLTLARVVMIPAFLAVLLLVPYPWGPLIGAAVYAVASATDAIDGHLARKNNQVTDFGKFLDPLADKMLTTAALLAFMELGLCNVWIIMVILTREFLVTSFRLVASAQGVVIAAGIWGKLKTASQMVFSIIIMFAIHFFEHYSLDFGILSVASNVMLGITALLTVISGIKYIVDGVKVIDISM